MKLDEVKNLIRKGSRRNDDFAEQFMNDAQGDFEAFKDKYFANDPETLSNLDQMKDELSKHQYQTAAVLTGSGGCRCVTYYESDPYFDGGAGSTAP